MKSMGAQNPSRGDGDVFDLHLRLHPGRVEASVPNRAQHGHWAMELLDLAVQDGDFPLWVKTL